MTKSYIRTDEEEDTPVYGISFFKTGSSERAIRDFSDVLLSEDEAAEDAWLFFEEEAEA